MSGTIVRFTGLGTLLLVILSCGPQDKTTGPVTEERAVVVETSGPDESAADPYLWLEAVEGDRALAWAAEQNRRSVPRLQGDPRYGAVRARIHGILTADDRIPSPGLVDGQIYNFWQDDEQVRGILRRTTLASYASDSPQWETVLDVDRLAALENANWVYKGRTCLPGATHRCLIHLSDGGKDAVVLREFNLQSGQFVDGGFTVSEAKSRVDWLDENTLVLGTDYGPGSLTTSGYPRTLRLWRRGSPLAEAEQIVEVAEQDMSVGVITDRADGGNVSLVVHRPDFFTENTFLLSPNGDLSRIPLPVDADFRGVLGQYGLVLLRSAWDLGDGQRFGAGSLLAMHLRESVRTGTPEGLLTLIDPDTDDSLDAISGVATTSDAMYVTALKDVSSILLRMAPAAQGWQSATLYLPTNGTLRVVSADNYSDTVLVNFESFLVPDTLYLVENGASPRPIKTLAPRFDASSYVTEQYFATSADGTRIPYYVVRPRELPMDGSTPTVLTAYGGFEVSRTPAYLSALDQSWLSMGGAIVLANIRGGGEYGPRWHQAALLENRQRAFDDFIAVAEAVSDSGLTSPPRLGIRGGSNGGLLVTAVMVQRPELFGAVISAVPLIDMLRYHRLLAGASWMAEYGNPDTSAHREFIAAYSPYQNVSPDADYPEIFLWTNPKDDRVHPGHARKMAARMLEQGHEVIYFENQEGGHGGGANLNQQAVTDAMQVVYLLQRLSD